MVKLQKKGKHTYEDFLLSIFYFNYILSVEQ
jgi:hypothetical protein